MPYFTYDTSVIIARRLPALLRHEDHQGLEVLQEMIRFNNS